MKKMVMFISSCIFVLATHLIASHAGAFGGGGSVGSGFESQGGFDTTSGAAGRSCTFYRPVSLDGTNPIILWGNGTNARPSSYAGLLRHWASWGFFVIAANTTNAGTGEDMLGCLDWLESSTYAGQVDLSKVGTSGHSQGGGGAIMAGVDSRITTTAPIEGYTLGLGHSSTSHTRQSGPMLLLSGSADTLVNPRTNHAGLFRRANVPVFWAILQGASHFEPVGDGGGFRGITTAWFMYQLRFDDEAAEEFEGSSCGYCTNPAWEVQSKSID